MSALSAHPTTLTLTAPKPISLTVAQERLSTYLKRSETQPHLHPDALLQASGPTFSVHGGRQGGLVLNQLRRVEAGLRGEILKPEPKALREGEKESDDTRLDALIAGSEAQAKRKGGLKRKAGHEDTISAVEAQDLPDAPAQNAVATQLDSDNEMDLPDGAEVGELGERSNLVEDGCEVPEVKTPGKSDVEKQARKAAKKERKKADKIERAAKRPRTADQAIKDSERKEKKRNRKQTEAG